jgi:lysophospholipase
MNVDELAANIKKLDLSRVVEKSPAEQAYFQHYGLDFEDRYAEISHYFGHFPCGRFDTVAHYFKHQNAVGSCILVHGYFDHSGLYRHLIDYCLKRRLSVVIYDLPGHGLSMGKRASIEDFTHYQEVLLGVLEFFKDQTSTPWSAIGQSTGAAILMDFLLSGGRNVFSKTVLLAPLVRPAVWPLSSFSHSVVRLFLRRIKRTFTSNSHDQKFIDFLQNDDPLQYRYLPMQWITSLKRWMAYFQQLPAIDYQPLIIQGKEDTTVDWKYNIPVVQAKFSRAKVFYLQTARHQLVNESEDIRRRIYSAMDVYFDSTTGQ